MAMASEYPCRQRLRRFRCHANQSNAVPNALWKTTPEIDESEAPGDKPQSYTTLLRSSAGESARGLIFLAGGEGEWEGDAAARFGRGGSCVCVACEEDEGEEEQDQEPKPRMKTKNKEE